LYIVKQDQQGQDQDHDLTSLLITSFMTRLLLLYL